MSDPQIQIQGELGSFQSSLSLAELEPGLSLLTLRLSSAQAQPLPALKLIWEEPVLDVQATWTPAALHDKTLAADWSPGFSSSLTLNAPVLCLHNGEGLNRLSFACSELVLPLSLHAGFREESKALACSIGLFQNPGPSSSHYEITLRLDRRSLPFQDSLAQVAAWWETLPGGKPCAVPEAARLPSLSTWYSFHQHLDAAALEAQAVLSKDFGFGSMIVDDGWQTADVQRGYAFCGDWEVEPSRFPDMASHVAAVQAQGLKYMLWVAPSLLGKSSKAFKALENKCLAYDPGLQAGILDPSFPEVRQHLIDCCSRALRDWNLDGFKFDFIDQFAWKGAQAPAAQQLMHDLHAALRKIKPELLIEFRQAYTGPAMRPYANMLRAADCPGDALSNRIRCLDLRCLSGKTAVHSDMLAWPLDAPAEVAALQLLNVLFSVPQISVRLDTLPQGQRQMLAFWLGFWRKHRALLLDAPLEPMHPELNYTQVLAGTATQCLAVSFSGEPVDLSGKPQSEFFVVNARLRNSLALRFSEKEATWEFEAFDCRGLSRAKKAKINMKNLQELEVPASGLLYLAKCP